MNTPLIVLLLSLLLVFFQDWKYRRIHILLPLILLLFAWYIVPLKGIVLYKNLILNLGFLLITLSILILYMSIKNKRFLNPFQYYFGLGDLLFYMAVTPLFVMANYILFFIFSMIFAIGMQIVLKKTMQENTVPLAGFSALLLIIILIKDSLFFFKKITLL